MSRDRSLVPLARLHFLPGMRQRTDRAREHEQAPAEWGRKAQFSVNDRGRAVDIHWDTPAFAGRQGVFQGPADGRKAAVDAAFCGRLVNQSEQARRAWVKGVEAMAEARHVADRLLRQRLKL